jgi:hypothetical protein
MAKPQADADADADDDDHHGREGARVDSADDDVARLKHHVLPCLAQLLGGRCVIDGEREDYGVWGDRRRRRRRRERRRKAHRR